MTQSPSMLPLVIAGLYLAVGIGVGVLLARRGAGRAASLVAIGAWPLLLSGLDPGPPTVHGPLGARIHEVFRALDAALADPAAVGLPVRSDVDGLREALLRADQRLGLADRLLREVTDADPDVARSRGTLADARAHAAAEIEAVLSGVVQVRLQIGLLALAGDAGGVAERLRQLRARVTAIEEVEAHLG